MVWKRLKLGHRNIKNCPFCDIYNFSSATRGYFLNVNMNAFTICGHLVAKNDIPKDGLVIISIKNTPHNNYCSRNIAQTHIPPPPKKKRIYHLFGKIIQHHLFDPGRRLPILFGGHCPPSGGNIPLVTLIPTSSPDFPEHPVKFLASDTI